MVSANGSTEINVNANLYKPASLDFNFDVEKGQLHTELNGFNVGPNSPPGVLEGQQGSHHEFDAIGDFTGTLSTSVGSYGELHTEVYAKSNSPAQFIMQGWQDFEVSGGNPGARKKIGMLGAYVNGTEGAEMNVDFTGSMYMFKDHGPYTYPDTPNPSWTLKGTGEYEVSHYALVHDKDNDNSTAISSVHLAGNGEGMFGFSNAWAFKTTAGGLNYPESPTMYVEAIGEGVYKQYGYGENYLKMNGFELPSGGSMDVQAMFNNGFSANPSCTAS